MRRCRVLGHCSGVGLASGRQQWPRQLAFWLFWSLQFSGLEGEVIGPESLSFWLFSLLVVWLRSWKKSPFFPALQNLPAWALGELRASQLPAFLCHSTFSVIKWRLFSSPMFWNVTRVIRVRKGWKAPSNIYYLSLEALASGAADFFFKALALSVWASCWQLEGICLKNSSNNNKTWPGTFVSVSSLLQGKGISLSFPFLALRFLP